MKRLLRTVLLPVFCSMFIVHSSFAQTFPYSQKVGAAVANLIALKASERVTGTAINVMGASSISYGIAEQVAAPQYQKTVEAASVALTGLVTAAVSVAGAPVWATIAIGTLAAVAVPLGVNSAAKWLFNSDGTVTTQSGSTGTSSNPNGTLGASVVNGGSMIKGGAYWQSGEYVGGSSELVVRQDMASRGMAGWPMGFAGIAAGGNIEMFWYDNPAGNGPYEHWGTHSAHRYETGAPISCDIGQIAGANGCQGLTVPLDAPDPSATSTKSMASAIADIPASDFEKPANPEILAAIANKAWQSAAATAGTIPYDDSYPITPADVIAWQGVASAAYPTVGDLVSSAVHPVTGAVSVPIPGAVGATNTGTATATQTTTTTETGSTSTINISIDWGTFIAPDVSSPSIESILDPLLNLWPQWKNFAFPAHASECPAPSFQLPDGVLGGHTIVFDQMCNFLEASHVREGLQAAFAVAWAILIIFIVMGA